MRDPYDVLGVPKTADDKAVKNAYRKLARESHPDLHPNDKAAEDRFKEVQAAYDFLSDKDKRAAYDRGEIDAAGAPRGTHTFYRNYAEGAPGGRYHDADEVFGNFGADDIFKDLFRSAGFRGGRGSGTIRMRGADMRFRLDVDFLDAVKGAERRLALPDGKRLKVKIPPGSEDGQTLRLKGQGGPGMNGGAAGDAFIEIHVRPHPTFQRKGRDILVDLPITLDEAILGAKIEVPTIDGQVTMSVPAGSNTGSRLRLKGKGVHHHGGARGDQYVTLKVVLPDPPDPALREMIADWAKAHSYDVRGKETSR